MVGTCKGATTKVEVVILAERSPSREEVSISYIDTLLGLMKTNRETAVSLKTELGGVSFICRVEICGRDESGLSRVSSLQRK